MNTIPDAGAAARAPWAITRRSLAFLGLALGTGLLAASGANAQDYPTRPIHIVTPYPAGGNSDNLVRMIAKDVGAILGQPIVIENKPGAGGSIGTAAVVKSAPDGYTLLFTTSNITVDQSLRPTLPYKAEVDLIPITKFVSAPLVLLLNQGIKVNSVREFVDYGKTNPKSVFYVTYGVGATNHIVGELFKLQTGMSMDPVPFKAMADAMPAFTDNQVQANFEILALANPLAATGKARIMAITSNARDPNAPNVPTMAEAGFPDFDASIWFGLFAPRGTPLAIVNKFQAAVAQMLSTPEMKNRLREMSLQGGGNTPADFAAEVAKDQARWRTVITRAGIQIKE